MHAFVVQGLSVQECNHSNSRAAVCAAFGFHVLFLKAGVETGVPRLLNGLFYTDRMTVPSWVPPSVLGEDR